MKKRHKRLCRRDEGLDLTRAYGISEALTLIKERSFVKFDETVEVIFGCHVDPRKGDQNLRGMVTLPKGTGKQVRVAVFAQGEQAHQAQEAGADRVGAEDLMEEVQKGQFDFDLCIAVPALMGQLGKLGKILGPKGLMPNPKLGTVTMDVGEAVRRAKQGQASLRVDKQGIIHTIMGRVSFSVEDLVTNFQAIYEGLLELKPASLKGALVKRAFVSSTMGFALSLDLSKPLS